MNIDNDSHLDLERLLHDLICGSLSDGEREEVLSEICSDQGTRNLLAEMLNMQKQARAASGYDQAERQMQASLSRLKAVLAKSEQPKSISGGSQGQKILLPMLTAAWLWRIAAVVVIGVSLYVAITAHRSNQFLQDQLAQISQRMGTPVITVSATDLAQYRLVWNQVSDGANTWVLLRNGQGEFGSINSHPPTELTGEKVVLLQYRIVDQAGRSVYAADLLVPDRLGIDVKVPDAGSIAGLPVSLALTTTQGQATVGLSVAGPQAGQAGVVGQTSIGAASGEIGSFKITDESLRVFVKTQRLNRFRI